MSAKIDQYCKQNNLSYKEKNKVYDFLEFYGEETIIKIFEELQPLPPDANRSRFSQFCAIQREVSQERAMAKKRSAESERWEEIRKEYLETYNSGFRPTPETLKRQLDDLLDRGEINQQAYEWGLKGIDLVLDAVPTDPKAMESASRQVEEELEEIPF